MPRTNPLVLKRPGEIVDTREFTDIAQSRLVPVITTDERTGEKIPQTYKDPETGEVKPVMEREFLTKLTLTFTLEADGAQDMAIQAKSQEFVTDYVVGRKGGPAAPLSVDGKRIPITPRLCATIAAFMAADTPGEGEERYGFHEWAAWSSVMPNAWEEMQAWYQELSDRAAVASKN